ncbi:isoprenylcysteine carboxylmethyltransferase family protein [Gramella sp. BOM4]|nr:isoprenylcysteine carboxylmethyltransferase family protein [Christiangramia bathymodioli]
MRLKKKDYFFVGIQLLLFVLYYFDFRILKLAFPQFLKDSFLVFAILGAVISLVAILQLKRNLSPFPTPKSGGSLIRSGLYKYVRHPIYSGILIAFGSYSIYSASGFRFLVSLALYVLFSLKIAYEEQLLLRKFDKYREYMANTGKFIPKL